MRLEVHAFWDDIPVNLFCICRDSEGVSATNVEVSSPFILPIYAETSDVSCAVCAFWRGFSFRH